MEIGNWQAQLRKGAAELVVLAVLRQGEAYGLEILDRANAGGELVSDGALYPLLARLEKSGRIAGRWVLAEAGGNPRKYYALTPDGRRMLGEMRGIWTGFRGAIDRAVVEGDEDA